MIYFNRDGPQMDTPVASADQIEFPSRQSAAWEAARAMSAGAIPTGLPRQVIMARVCEWLQKECRVTACAATIFRALRRCPRRQLIRIDRV
jgi:hypothetical protein